MRQDDAVASGETMIAALQRGRAETDREGIYPAGTLTPYCERLTLDATDLMISIVWGETCISDMYNLVSGLLYTQESREQGLIFVGFLIRIKMQLCYQAAGEALQSQR